MLKKIVKGIAQLASGNVLGQTISITAMPLLSRLYTPEEFGKYGVAFSIMGFVSILLTMRLELTILENKRSTQESLELSVALAMIMAVLTAPLVLIASSFLYGFSGVICFGIVFGALGFSLFQIFSCSKMKEEQFARLSRIIVIKNILVVALQVVGYFLFGDPVLALVWGISIAYLLASVFLFLDFGKRPGWFRPVTIDIKSVWRRVWDESETIKYAGGHALANSAFQLVPYLVLPLYAGGVFTGLFLFADRIFRLPLNVIGQPIRQVFLSYCFKEKNKNVLFRTYVLITAGCAAIALLISLLIYSFGEGAFGFVFGERYSGAAIIAFWLSIWGVGAFSSFPALALLRAFGKNKIIMMNELIFGVLKTLFILFSLRMGADGKNAIAVFSVISALAGLFLIYHALKVVRSSIEMPAVVRK